MAKKQYQLVSCTINGREVEQMVDVRASLTDMLRNDPFCPRLLFRRRQLTTLLPTS